MNEVTQVLRWHCGPIRPAYHNPDRREKVPSSLADPPAWASHAVKVWQELQSSLPKSGINAYLDDKAGEL
jgi:hypothetical protein